MSAEGRLDKEATADTQVLESVVEIEIEAPPPEVEPEPEIIPPIATVIEVQPPPETEAEPVPVVAPQPSTWPLLFEVGCEEIPARFLADAERHFGERLLEVLQGASLFVQPAAGAEPAPRRRSRSKPPAPLQTYSTPRRLAAYVPALVSRQPDRVEDLMGPPAKVAFDAQGKPTRAAESFAAKSGVAVEELLQVETPKGLYLSAKKTISGRPAADVLAEILPAVVRGLTFPKSMVWEAGGTRFVRPIRWILALFGEGEFAHTVDFEIAGVRSGRATYRHRLERKPMVEVLSFKDYVTKLRRGNVEIDSAKRALRVRSGIKVILDGFTGNSATHEDAAFSAVPDAWLEDWIVCSTEWPTPILGGFEERFLDLPREILITVMRDHQKYFAVERVTTAKLSSDPSSLASSENGGGILGDSTAALDAEPPIRELLAPLPTKDAGIVLEALSPSTGGVPDVKPPAEKATLAPYFVTVLNVPGDSAGVIRRGHERVLTARLEDARFFWHADQKIPLSSRVVMLERVTYQAKLGDLGSYAAKIDRMEAIGSRICSELEHMGRLTPAETGFAERAIELSKCDLTTQMVQEFTELQGQVGGRYAEAQGEPEGVWQAIYDHYRPQSLEDECPRSLAGAVVALADKLDAVVCGFAADLAPTGSSDPFALRRAGNGIVKILLHFSIPIETGRLIRFGTEALGPLGPENRELAAPIGEFLNDRLRYYLEASALRYDTVRAVVRSSPSVVKALELGQALEMVRYSEDFAAVASAARRTRNILSKSAKAEDLGGASAVDPGLLRLPEERELYEASQSALVDLARFEASADYQGAFRRLAELRPFVDRFFDKVMVMDQDLAVRANRLRLLVELDERVFRRLADLSEIEAGDKPGER